MISCTDLTKQFGSRILFKNASFQINPGDHIGLVGPNGAGKSTIFRLLTKQEGVDSGQISVPEKISLAYFSQDVHEMSGRSALEEVKSAAGDIPSLEKKLKRYEADLEASATSGISDDDMQRLLENYGEAQSQFERLGGYDLDARAQEILTGLGIGPDDYHRDTGTFSGGWKMRIELAKVLIQNPDVLLMDEPTNHLDMESIVWLEEWLGKYPGTLVMTSHDRDFMNRLVTRIIEVANKTITSYSGNYDFYERERGLRREQQRAAFERQQEMLAKEEEFIARFAARASHAAQVQSRVKKLEKIDRIELPSEEKTIKFSFPTPPRGGDDVATFKDLGKIWRTEDGREKRVFTGASATIKRLDRVAVVGVNGAGKSTLLKMLMGATEPTEGKLQIGPSIRPGYFSQSSLDVLHSGLTIEQEVHNQMPNSSLGTVRNLLGAFKFSGDEVEKKISVLSGGEKSRVVLATILTSPCNFLVLDEPTNHLDIASREVLLEAILGFEGTIAIVSHDRYFLRKIATRVFELDRNKLTIYEGNYEYYLWKKSQNH